MFPNPSELGPFGSPLPQMFGRYRVVQRLGQGGMGSVFLAEDTRLGRKVALKMPTFGPGDSTEFRLRFEQEARAAATLEHPSLCRVYDVGEVDGHPYLTMEYIEGASLARVIASQGGTLPPATAAAIVARLALGLQEAHSRKVIHRDLKPSNVMIRSTGGKSEPVIVDFGLARLLVEGGPETPKLTRTGHAMGTLAYMSPEQLRGESDVGPAADIFSLGVILYELLAGEPPFQGPGLMVAAQVLNAQPAPPSATRPGVAPALDAICLKAMAKAPADRYTSMSEFAAELSRYLRTAREGVPGGTSAIAAPKPEPGRRPGLVLAGVAMIALSGSVIGYILMQGRGPGPEAEAEAVAANPAPGADSKDSEGWVELFNHRDLTGWAEPNTKVNPSRWEVKDGCMIGHPLPGSVAAAIATARRDYKNFRLRVVSKRTTDLKRLVIARWRVEGNRWWGYAAVTNGPRFEAGHAIPLGSLYRGDGVDLSYINTNDPSEWALAPGVEVSEGDWVTLEMTVVGGRVLTTVNGQPGAELDLPDKALAPGSIGFGFRDVPIRDVLVKEFSNDDTKAAVEAGLARTGSEAGLPEVDFRAALIGRWNMVYNDGGENVVTFHGDGTSSRSHDGLKGTWSITGRKVVVEFSPPAHWEGTLSADGQTLQARSRKGGSVAGRKLGN